MISTIFPCRKVGAFWINTRTPGSRRSLRKGDGAYRWPLFLEKVLPLVAGLGRARLSEKIALFA